MILDLCGGEASEIEVAGARARHRAQLPRSTPAGSRASSAWTCRATSRRASSTALGFSGDSGPAATLDVSVPSWRPDVQGEADLVEEIARVASLSKLAGQADDPRPRRRPPGADADAAPRGRRRAGGSPRRGYNECVTYSFIDAAAAALFGGGVGGGAAREPDQLRDEPPAPGPAARPAARRRAQPGARLRRSRAVRGRRGLPRRRARRAAPAGRRPAHRRHRAARRPTARAGRSTSGTPAPTPRPRSPRSARPRR